MTDFIGPDVKRLCGYRTVRYVGPIPIGDGKEWSPQLAARLSLMLGDRFAVTAAMPSLADDTLFADEYRHIAHAAVKRRAEFATVRLCARRVLAELGVSPCSLVPLPDGSPPWPAGVIGSLSHTDDMCVAVATVSRVLAVGVDIEQDSPLDADLEEMICTRAEQRWIRYQDADLRGRLGKLFFSAKEAFYKCQHGLTGTMLDFTDVELAIDLRRQLFHLVRIHVPLATPIRLDHVRGRFGYTARHLATVAVLEQPLRRTGDPA